MFKFYLSFLEEYYPYSNKKYAKKNLVIVGNGWASRGLLSKINYNKYNVTVISKENYFNYTPLLAQSIDINKNVSNTFIPSNNKRINFIESNVTNFENRQFGKSNKVFFGKDQEIKYDYLVFCHGADIATYQIEGLNKKNVHFFKNYDNMIDLKKNLQSLKTKSNIAIMGCGPTGIEIISSLIDMNFNKKHNIYAIDGMSRPVNIFNKKLSDTLLDLWKKENINVMMNSIVEKIDNKKIYFDKRKLNYDLGIWCGGICSNQLTRNILKSLEYTHYLNGIPVNNKMMIQGNGFTILNAFAIGDCNLVNDAKYPKTAQIAYKQGQYLGIELNRNNVNDSFIKPFKSLDFGQFCYIGKNMSIYQGPYFSHSGYITNLVNQIVQVYNYFRTV